MFHEIIHSLPFLGFYAKPLSGVVFLACSNDTVCYIWLYMNMMLVWFWRGLKYFAIKAHSSISLGIHDPSGMVISLFGLFAALLNHFNTKYSFSLFFLYLLHLLIHLWCWKLRCICTSSSFYHFLFWWLICVPDYSSTGTGICCFSFIHTSQRIHLLY